MRNILFVLAVGLFTSAAFAQNLTLADSNSEVVAEVNGVKLTAAELELQEGSKLLQSRYAFYEVQRKALDDLIDQHLLEIEAHKQNLTVDKLLEREVKSKLPAEEKKEKRK